MSGVPNTPSMPPAEAVGFLAFVKPFSDDNRQKHRDAIDVLRLLVEEHDLWREELQLIAAQTTLASATSIARRALDG